MRLSHLLGAALMSCAMAASLGLFPIVPPHRGERGSRWRATASRYSGADIRRLAAERGVGAPRATLRRSKGANQ